MTRAPRFYAILVVFSTLAGCSPSTPSEPTELTAVEESVKTYVEDVAFLREHTDAVVLGEPGGPSVVVVPQFQGRVMTSTDGEEGGVGYGWIHYDLIQSGELAKHINAFGGEDRFWMGPEGGQFSIFFPAGSDFDFADWQTPAFIDSEPYRVVRQTDTEVMCAHEARVSNYSGTVFDLGIERTVRLHSAADIERVLGIAIPSGVGSVGYVSENTVTNRGEAPWRRDTGLLSIWVLGMFRHSPTTHVVIPYVAGPEEDLGPVVNDAYFGKPGPQRLQVKRDFIVFKGDGMSRGKIGVGPRRAKEVLGSFDPVRGVLTLVKYSLPEGVTDYVNSLWEIQDDPYAGDVVNSYNDGPTPDGAPIGPFYELETSSPALALAPGQSATHVHHTFHFRGPQSRLQEIATAVLGVNLDDVANAFPQGQPSRLNQR